MIDPSLMTDERDMRTMLNALRLDDGFDCALFTATTGLDRAAIQSQLDHAAQRDWLTIDAGRVRTTELGRRFLNDVIGSFLPARRRAGRTHGGPPHD